ncbi:MAG: protein-L-isoaspartate(D-aspartate) O-methyltransferase [Sulfuricurvum sp.]|uniref:protein-L-isoaspartate(D-aspartate) O-methyltransferase n=1 Tax=Sulfuricurvum sp. TaxID=2025608 RepID=UPI0026313CD3|nr:protein-L-isoaspartate(D-aspartate) O-methyltransferase [Sulfuricurvum sp.]MDD2369320.1 protein-L-isoaspartate(D-aspartate) O-methyltransferase [Sulfuricurvum sp.]MDD5117161.1 protein-L-isoaspartate(D-aspartate) O-methyltransferase [Sulfuricurvum sp.]
MSIDKITIIKTSRMAEEIAKKFPLRANIKEAIVHTNREMFVPIAMRHNAYRLDALPIGAQQYISSPLTVAKMTQYLSPEGCDSVLEIGCGSGYQAAVLSKVFRRVFTIERIESLLLEAKERFRTLHLGNIHTRTDDGQNGWEQYAPFDRILFSASARVIPQKLFDQLREGGILLAPMERGREQVITRFTKRGGVIHEDPLEVCDFVPVLDGVVR